MFNANFLVILYSHVASASRLMFHFNVDCLIENINLQH